MKYNFIKLERIQNLRDIWSHEAHHFTHWVADNGLKILSEELGISEIIDPVCEVSVGSKRADIVAKLKEDNKEVIIENQLEATNHDHLGKIVTYAAGRHEAAIVIWIVERATVEYRKAVDWLNKRTDNNIDFYLVEIQLWKIDQTNLLPRFNVIVRPAPKETYRELSESDKFFVDFWTEFNHYADSIPYHFFSPDENFNSRQKPHPENSYNLNVNGYKNLCACLIVRKKEKKVKTGIYIPKDKQAFAQLFSHKDEITRIFNSELEWNKGKKNASSVFLVKSYEDLESVEGQNSIFKWLCNTALVWKDIIKKYC